ncbi:hypothetical protein [Alloprevotella rava]|uniref:hypothetical protein n=1 Tax=Alloprevotella rava TaxID=671218 RepID=UPI00030892C0|nr:hypothetical protein [Alloprevotella rava]
MSFFVSFGEKHEKKRGAEGGKRKTKGIFDGKMAITAFFDFYFKISRCKDKREKK